MSLDAYPLVRDWLQPTKSKLVLRTGKVDLGQRISTALVRIACEELALQPDVAEVAPVRTGVSPDEGITSGSNSIEQSGRALRLACATARCTALATAAAKWNTEKDALTLDNGSITHRGTNQSLDVLALLCDLPEDLKVDLDASPRALQDVLDDMPPAGLRDMVTGQFNYIHDMEKDGMLHARIVRPPLTNANLLNIDAETSAKIEEKGIQILRDGAFLAVAGIDEWAVQRASDKLRATCEWDIGTGLETGDIFALLRDRDAQKFAVLDGAPAFEAEVSPPMKNPVYQQAFERPYTLHGALAPSAALATYNGGRLDIFTHSQGIYFLRDSIADSLGVTPENVVLEHVPGSGCYGHNGADDAAFEAALVATMLPGTPILLKYSREDEQAREPVGTAMRVLMQAHTGEDGIIRKIWMEARGDTHRGRPRAGANRAGPARLAANAARDCDVPRFVPEPNPNRHAGLHRNLDPIYGFAEKDLVKALVTDLPLRPSALRCLGAPTNILAIESMMDTLADAANADPIDFRIVHLNDARATRVLRELQDVLAKAPLPEDGSARGIAYAQYKNSMTRVALAVDLSVSDLGEVRLDHVRIVADAGRVVDPDGLRAQLEGGFLQGASWALHECVTWRAEGRETLDWESYPVLRFTNIPQFDIELMPASEHPAVGAGEASPSPAVAAIANALYRATGLRLTRMPFDRDAIIQAALNA